MKHPKLVAFGSAALVVLAAIGVAWYMARGSHLELRGSILKVRTAPLDENNSVAELDFRDTNVADYEFIVNPAFNADRGPVDVFGARFHAEF